jgi:hypothetical protein
MFSISAIKGKFQRSGIDFRKTFLFEENPSHVNSNDLSLFQINEKCIIYYIESSNYSWYLTDKRFIVPSVRKTINLSDLKNVDFTNLKANPSQKMENKELTLFTNNEEFNFNVEEKSWHLFYGIFKFIIENNN